MATKKTQAPAEETPKKPRTPRKTEKIIRNLRGMTIHVRLGNPKDPYRIELQPRGQRGDTATVPVSLQQETAYVKGVGMLFEVITKTEADAIQYGQIGYLQGPRPQIVREEDSVIRTEDDFHAEGRYDRQPARRSEDRVLYDAEGNPVRVEGHVVPDRGRAGVGPNVVADGSGIQGADAALAAGYQADSGALPPGVDFTRQKVTIEHKKGQ